MKARHLIWTYLLAGLCVNGAQAAEFVHFPGPGGAELTAWWQPLDHAAPAVIVMHGCGGLYGPHGELARRHAAMADFLYEQGYAVLMPDSFGARGKTQICTEKNGDRSITVQLRAQDALAARNWLDRQERVSPDQVALLGWSNGGSTVLRTAASAAANHRFRATVAFYSGCERLAGKVRQLFSPTLILAGEADDWTAIAPCRQLAGELGEAQLQVHGYPDTYHDFDNPALVTIRHRADVPNGTHPGQGVTIAPNRAAALDAWQRAANWLQAGFAHTSPSP
ncbi:dienelactone hydrolase family protein [Chitinimonas naiadis]